MVHFLRQAVKHRVKHRVLEAVILVDATNAFNSLNRQLAFHNICHICPLSKVLINTYRQGTSPLFIDNETISSLEGTTQGDPLAMAMYAVSIIPLIYRLKTPSIKQVWFGMPMMLRHVENSHQ